MKLHRIGICAVFALAMSATAAIGQVIDFQVLEHNDNLIAEHGYVYDEDGFRLSHPQSEPFEFGSFGTQEPRYPGSTALFNNTVDGVITLQQINGLPFDPVSIDISNLNNGGPVTVRFTGNVNGGGQVFGSYTTSGSQNQLETYVFPNDFANLDTLVWTQGAPFHQFDNIVIPEPATLSLLSVLGLLAIRRR